MRVFKKISYPGSVLNSEIAKNMQYGVQGEILGKEPELKSTTNPLIWGFAGYMYDPGSRKYSTIWRDYDQERGVFMSQDPLGLAGGDENFYRSAGNNSLRYVDPLGLYEISAIGQGTRGGAAYSDTIILTTDSGSTVIVSGSIQPNPNNSSPSISSGTYDSTYSSTGHKGRKPGVRVNNGGEVNAAATNQNNKYKNSSVGINIHCGDSFSNRGSQGCITIRPDQCTEFFKSMKEGETGPVLIEKNDWAF